MPRGPATEVSPFLRSRRVLGMGKPLLSVTPRSILQSIPAQATYTEVNGIVLMNNKMATVDTHFCVFPIIGSDGSSGNIQSDRVALYGTGFSIKNGFFITAEQ